MRLAVAVVMTAATAFCQNEPNWGAEVSLTKRTQFGGKPLREALEKRRSEREYTAKPIPLAVVSGLLWAGYGVNRPATGGRTAPTAHGWQVIDIYVVVKDGIYLYEAGEARLRRVSAEDAREISGTQDFVAGAPVNLVYVARMGKMTASAEDTAEDLLVWAAVEAGAIAQNIGLFCAAEGLGNVVRAGVQRTRFAQVAGLGPRDRILLAQTVGYGK